MKNVVRMKRDKNIEQIKSLLSRFYEGQTTPEEERLLADFFRREDVPEDLQQDKQLFLMLAQISDKKMPADIADEIATFVNNLGQTEKKPILSEVKHHKGIIYRLKTPPKMWYRVAATVAILFAIGGGVFFHQRTYTTDPFRDTCSTPEEAAAELHKANAMITKASQQCLAPTRNAFEQVEDTKEIINKHITF
jgi:hypothetical protein